MPDLIDDGVHGRLVPSRDPERLAGVAAELLYDPAAAAKMGRRARERQRAEFDLDRAVRRVEELYERLYETSDRGRRAEPAPPA